MMISEKMTAALNQQINNELNAAYSYRAKAFQFESMGYKVFARRFHRQAVEERDHAMKIAGYILDVGAKVDLKDIKKPKVEYPTVKEMVQAALDSELTVTQQINELVALAEKENDYTSRSFLQWFVDEQVEEVSSMSELLQWVTLAGEQYLFQVENRLLATGGPES